MLLGQNSSRNVQGFQQRRTCVCSNNLYSNISFDIKNRSNKFGMKTVEEEKTNLESLIILTINPKLINHIRVGCTS